MIVLDTNVVSELMKPDASGAVAEWIDSHAASSLYTTAITEAEILHGILLLPVGRRRAQLQAAAEGMFNEDFGGRVLAFGSDAARVYALIAAERRRAGRPMSHFDAQVAAIARATRAAIATRNTGDFVGCGVRVIDPWREGLAG